MTTVRDYMLRNPIVVRTDMSIYEAAERILENRVSGACVVDDSGKLVGMLSELDCLRVIVDNVYTAGDPGASLVEDEISGETETVHPDDNIREVASSMLDHKHRRRPVMEDGKLVGMLTCRQILAAVQEENEREEHI